MMQNLKEERIEKEEANILRLWNKFLRKNLR
jgi:hypothetical protein